MVHIYHIKCRFLGIWYLLQYLVIITLNFFFFCSTGTNKMDGSRIYPEQNIHTPE